MKTSFEVIKINRFDFLQFKSQFDTDILRCFPSIKIPRFYYCIKDLFKILENGIIKGILFTTKSEYSNFDCFEMSIIIFPKYQGNGIAKAAIEIISNYKQGFYFKIRKENIIAYKLFARFFEKKLEDDKYFIFSK